MFAGKPRGAVPIPAMPGPCLCLFPPLDPYIPHLILLRCFLLTTSNLGSDFPQWSQTYLVPAFQLATVSSSSPYYIHLPNFLSPLSTSLSTHSTTFCLTYILPLNFAANYEIKMFLLFIAMPHQRCHNCLYKHSSSVPVQNKTNQFRQTIKLISPSCHERDWLLQSSSNRTSQGPSLVSCSRWILKCMSV